MRTTIVIDESLGQKLKKMSGRRGLSRFISGCVREHFERQEKLGREAELEKAYARAAKGRRGSTDFESIDHEDWPEW